MIAAIANQTAAGAALRTNQTPVEVSCRNRRVVSARSRILERAAIVATDSDTTFAMVRAPKGSHASETPTAIPAPMQTDTTANCTVETAAATHDTSPMCSMRRR